MTFSFIVLIWCLILQFVKNNLIKSDFLDLKHILGFFTIILFETFRIYCQSVFPDIPNYEIIFYETESADVLLANNFDSDFFISNVEIGFSLLISFFKYFSNSFNLFLFFVSVTEWLIFYFFCKKYKLDFINSIPIYLALTFLTFQIGMLRQALAFCFFLLGLLNVEKKLLFLIFLLIGLTFHTSIIFCFFLLWIDTPVSKKVYLISFLLALFIYIFKIDIIDFSLPYFEIEDSIRSARASYYVNMVDRPNSYFGIGFWERIVLFFSMYIIQSRLLLIGKVDKNSTLIFNLGMFAILFQMIFFSSPTITSRLRYYVVLFPAIFISQFIHIEFKNSKTIFLQTLFNFYLAMYLIFQASYLNHGLNP